MISLITISTTDPSDVYFAIFQLTILSQLYLCWGIGNDVITIHNARNRYAVPARKIALLSTTNL